MKIQTMERQQRKLRVKAPMGSFKMPASETGTGVPNMNKIPVSNFLFRSKWNDR